MRRRVGSANAFSRSSSAPVWAGASVSAEGSALPAQRAVSDSLGSDADVWVVSKS